MKAPRLYRLLLKLSLFLFIIFVTKEVFADPAVNYVDPGMTHVVYGLDRYPTRKEEWTIDLSISPFYQHATGARNKFGKKEAIGNRLGRWEMLGVIWGRGDDEAKDPAVEIPGSASGSCGSTGATVSCVPTVPAATLCNDKEFYESYPKLTHTMLYADYVGIGRENSYEGTTDIDGDYSVSVTYEKKGLRLNFDASIASGFGITIKSGIVSYVQKPQFHALIASDLKTAYEQHQSSPSESTEALANIYLFYLDTLLSTSMRHAIVEGELGLDLSAYETVAFEDTFVQGYWSHPFEFADKEGMPAVTVSPYVGAGIWLPTGKKKHQDKAFSLPTGHDGFWGVSLEGAINFDFYETVLVNFGAGVTFFQSKTLKNQRVPNHYTQASLYPWKTDIKRRYGTGWNFNVSLYGKDIVDTLSVYFDYIYAQHEADSISLCSSSAGGGTFLPKMLEEDSRWRSQVFQIGFDYRVTPDLALGFSGQTHLSGRQVYKTHTIMGTVTFTF